MNPELELTWAAGLFDARGTVEPNLLKLKLKREDLGLLQRFRHALGGLGNISNHVWMTVDPQEIESVKQKLYNQSIKIATA